VADDPPEAVEWYRKAAEAGNAYGMLFLGRMYEAGRGGLRKDKTQALEWYRKAGDAAEDAGMNHFSDADIKRLTH
jgi:uncharacterized protein